MRMIKPIKTRTKRKQQGMKKRQQMKTNKNKSNKRRPKKPPMEPPAMAAILEDDEGEVSRLHDNKSSETIPLQSSQTLVLILKNEVEGHALQFVLPSLVPLQRMQELLMIGTKMVFPGQGSQEEEL